MAQKTKFADMEILKKSKQNVETKAGVSVKHVMTLENKSVQLTMKSDDPMEGKIGDKVDVTMVNPQTSLKRFAKKKKK